MWDVTLGMILGFFLINIISAPTANIPSGKWWKTNYDETDNTVADERSGMAVFTDYGTGCQYLMVSPMGGLTPRLDSRGNIICRTTKHKE